MKKNNKSFEILKCFSLNNWIFVFVSIGLIVLQVWLELLMPDYTAKLTKAVSSGMVTMNDVWVNGGYMLACGVGSLISMIICGYIISKIASDFAFRLREKVFNKVCSFSDAETEKFTTASLITRTTNDTFRLNMFVVMGLQMLVKAPITAIWAITKISSVSISWTLATIICVIVMLVVVGVVVIVCLPKFKKVQKLIDNLNSVARDNISGVRVVRAFNAEDYQEEKFEVANKELMQNQLITSKMIGLMMPVLMMCMNGLTLAIYWIGAYLMNAAPIIERATIIGNMTSFTQYALDVVMSFVMLIVVFIMLPRAVVSAKRIREVLKTEPSIVSGEKTKGKRGQVGTVEFKNVSFRYPDGQGYVLKNLSFEAKQGETVAIIGATGSGKSTLINLISRTNDVSEGEILVDGVNVKDYDYDALQSKVSIASQKPVLFIGDIKSNITYGKEGVADDDKKLKESLEVSQADFVWDLDEKIHGKVAQLGTNFSGGQKQRLSIARAIFKDAEIVVFDDSFSALDYKTDMLLRKALKEKFNDKTIFIVAQRIGSIKNADKIIVLEDGEIVSQGKHKDLLKTCPVYKEIALSQLSKEEL